MCFYIFDLFLFSGAKTTTFDNNEMFVKKNEDNKEKKDLSK